MFRSLDRVTDSSFVHAVTLNWQRDESLAGPYRKLRVFKDSDAGIAEYGERGVAYEDSAGRIYYVDAVSYFRKSAGKTVHQILELGFHEMSGLPSEKAEERANPNEWLEATSLFIGDAPDDVKADIRELLDQPKEWPEYKPHAQSEQEPTFLARPYRKLRTFRAPPHEYDILEGNRRGIAYTTPEGKLYYADAVAIRHDDASRPEDYFVKELGYQEMKGLPAEGKNGRVNPNEWEELKANLIGDAPEDVKNDLRKLLRQPREWPNYKPRHTPGLQ